MARIRTIKPEFWEDEKIGSLSHGARLLFLCCLNLSDDEGILRWNAFYLASNAFMYDEIKAETIDKWMNELVDNELIYVYQAGSLRQRYGYIKNFSKHQKVDRPQPSKFPSPDYPNCRDKNSTNVRRMFDECSTTEREKEKEKDNTPYIPLSGDGINSSDSKFSVKRQQEKKEKVARKRKELDLSIVEPTFQPIVADWLAYKSERGQTYQQRGFDAFYRKLTELSSGSADTARNIIEQSMANNWAGIFSVKSNNYGPTAKNHPPGDDELARAVAEGVARANTRQEWE